MHSNTLIKQAKEDRLFYAEQTPEAWKQMIAAVRIFGLTLVSSRFDLPPDEWRQLVTDDLPFDLAVASRIVKSAQSQQIPGTVELSGPYCFHELIHLEESTFRYGLDRCLLTATCSPLELAALRKRYKSENH